MCIMYGLRKFPLVSINQVMLTLLVQANSPYTIYNLCEYCLNARKSGYIRQSFMIMDKTDSQLLIYEQLNV